MSKTSSSPLMEQYRALKAKHADCLLLFQVGDFYETFEQDATTLSTVLDITLTQRWNLDMAGFPISSLEQYVPSLVQAGHRVAICEQMTGDAIDGLITRKVTQIVTPGINHFEPTDVGSGTIHHSTGSLNNFLAAIHINGVQYGLAFLDVSTGEFYGGEGDKAYTLRLLDSFKPVEVIFERSFEGYFREVFGTTYFGYAMDKTAFEPAAASTLLMGHFQATSLKGFGIEGMPSAVIACGVILQYLADTQHPNLRHITAIQRLSKEGFLWMDAFTVRNLELLKDDRQPEKKTLQGVMDSTVSPMGGRLLKRWLLLPLTNNIQIQERLALVDHFITEGRIRGFLTDHIKAAGDVERLASKVALKKVTPKQVRQIAASLQAIQEIIAICNDSPNAYLKHLSASLNGCPEIAERTLREILPNPAASIDKGYIFQEGVDEALDQLKQLSVTSKQYLDYLGQREASATGIHSLKIGYHTTYGYFLEVPKTLKASVPADWSLKQTLSGTERYATEELKTYEARIISADERIKEIEAQRFSQLLEELGDYARPLQQNGIVLATIDCLASFAVNAIQHNYVRPALTENGALDFKDSRHPVVEQQCAYVANDLYLHPDEQQIIIISGPNMSGKSAILRQTALITVMAHMGSFVPASQATIPLTDKIFTRVGASDNLSGGESTFMVEMNETANILNNLSSKSLVLLDEIGRGTATYDGISIAWAIVEYLHGSPLRPKTLFATHYHELNDLETQLVRVRSFHITHEENENSINFLRRLEAGGSTHSFGIQVAKMAGMPPAIVQRAAELLADMEARSGVPPA